MEKQPIPHTMQPTPVQMVMPHPQVGPQPMSIECRSCRKTITTRMDYINSTKTHLIAGLLFVLGCWLCCCIPYCSDSCRNINHYCPHCHAYIGTYKQ